MAGLRFFSERVGDGAGVPVLDTKNNEEVLHVKSGVSIVIGNFPPENHGTVYITSRQIIWLSDLDRAKGYSLDLLSVLSYIVEISKYPVKCTPPRVCIQIDSGDISQNDSRKGTLDLSNITEMRLIPSDPTHLDGLLEFIECAELHHPSHSIRTVKVSNVSVGTKIQDIQEFFADEIDYIKFKSDSERSKIAFVTFMDAQGANNAVILSGATIKDQSVTVTLDSEYQLPPAAFQTGVEVGKFGIEEEVDKNVLMEELAKLRQQQQSMVQMISFLAKVVSAQFMQQQNDSNRLIMEGNKKRRLTQDNLSVRPLMNEAAMAKLKQLMELDASLEPFNKIGDESSPPSGVTLHEVLSPTPSSLISEKQEIPLPVLQISTPQSPTQRENMNSSSMEGATDENETNPSENGCDKTENMEQKRLLTLEEENKA